MWNESRDCGTRKVFPNDETEYGRKLLVGVPTVFCGIQFCSFSVPSSETSLLNYSTFLTDPVVGTGHGLMLYRGNVDFVPGPSSSSPLVWFEAPAENADAST